MIPEAVRRERQQRCDCGATDGQLHSPGCACWPRPRKLYHWLSEKRYREFSRDRYHWLSEKRYREFSRDRPPRWDRIFCLAVRVRHPWLWSRGR